MLLVTSWVADIRGDKLVFSPGGTDETPVRMRSARTVHVQLRMTNTSALTIKYRYPHAFVPPCAHSFHFHIRYYGIEIG